MNRIEYMRRLAALLQDVPVEERVAAMQYYNDYFDDAGEENEDKVIAELGSPEKVAAEMKAGLGRQTEDSGEFRETGYADTQFEEKEPPVRYGTDRKPWTNRWLKLALIILIILVGAPILVPIAIAFLCVVLALVITAFAIFVALAIAAVAIAISGVALFVKGGFWIIVSIPAALSLMGIGLILAVIGVIGTVAAVRLCVIVWPGLFRFFVDLCRRPFQKRRAVA